MSDWLLQDYMELVNLATGATIQLTTAERWDSEKGGMIADGENVDIEHQVPGLTRTLYTGPSEEGEKLLMDLVLQLDAMVLFTKDSLTVEWWREKLQERGLT